ncbi:hypothetical protein F4802DRAFT_545412 [Xylaria palmicola]|nr:hypothetical protein F4802DRAFT_545412 [Xylaria palmicola]
MLSACQSPACFLFYFICFPLPFDLFSRIHSLLRIPSIPFPFVSFFLFFATFVYTVNGRIYSCLQRGIWHIYTYTDRRIPQGFKVIQAT